MLVPLSWLKDYVPLPEDRGVLVERLTLAGLESSEHGGSHAEELLAEAARTRADAGIRSNERAIR